MTIVPANALVRGEASTIERPVTLIAASLY
jgi:hypothetical protein